MVAAAWRLGTFGRILGRSGFGGEISGAGCAHFGRQISEEGMKARPRRIDMIHTVPSLRGSLVFPARVAHIAAMFLCSVKESK
jgi:hypothetical protein